MFNDRTNDFRYMDITERKTYALIVHNKYYCVIFIFCTNIILCQNLIILIATNVKNVKIANIV